LQKEIICSRTQTLNQAVPTPCPTFLSGKEIFGVFGYGSPFFQADKARIKPALDDLEIHKAKNGDGYIIGYVDPTKLAESTIELYISNPVDECDYLVAFPVEFIVSSLTRTIPSFWSPLKPKKTNSKIRVKLVSYTGIIFAESRDHLQEMTGARRIHYKDSGKLLSSFPEGVFGFINSWGIFSPSETTLLYESEGTADLEIHIGKGKRVFAVGYMNPELVGSLVVDLLPSLCIQKEPQLLVAIPKEVIQSIT